MPAHVRRLLSQPPLYYLAMLLLLALAAPAMASQYSLSVNADPQHMPYDATQVNRSTIRVQVFLSGRPAPDATQVHFTTTLGSFQGMANVLAGTQGGQVAVQLTNEQQGPGTAMVTIQAGDAQQILQIDFYGPGGAKSIVQQKRLSYRIRAKQVYYSTEQQVCDVPYNGEFSMPGLSVKAGALQFSLRKQLITAQRHVEITVDDAKAPKGKRTITAENFSYDLNLHTGALLEMDEQLQVHFQTITDMKFTLADVKDTDRVKYKDTFLAQKATPTRYWIISKEVFIYPGKELHFRSPEFYLNGANFCFMHMPYHVIFLNEPSDNMFLAGTMSLTSEGGIDADLPIYYAANDGHIGSIHIRNVTPGSALYRGTSGLQLGVEEEFHNGMTGDGTLFLDDLTRDTRSLTWDENQAFGLVHSSFGGSFTRYTDTTPYTTTGYLNLSRPFGKYSASLTTNLSMYGGTDTGLTELAVTTPQMKLWHTGLALGINPYIGMSLQQNAATTSSPAATATNFYQGLRNSLAFPNYPFLKGAFAPSMSDEISHDETGKITNFFDSSLRYQHAIGKFTSSVSYSYGLQTSNQDTVPAVPAQSVSVDLLGNRPNWQFYSNSSYDLVAKSSYSSANLRYYLPWNQRKKDKHRNWYVEYTGNVSEVPGTALITDHLVSLGRSLGTYALLVHYSPTGNTAVTGIGTGTGTHWSFELVHSSW